MQEIRELTVEELETISGGALHLLGAAVVIYSAASIVYDFGGGFSDGLMA